MKNSKKIFVAFLVMAMVVANVGFYRVNAANTDADEGAQTDIVEHIEEATEQLELDLTNGKTATFTAPENLEPIGTVTYYGPEPVLVSEGDGGIEALPTEVTFVEVTNPEDASIKTEKTGATEYTVTAFHTEGMPIVTVPVKLITKKLVNTTTTSTGVTIDGDDTIRQDDYYLVTTYTVLFRVGYGEPETELQEITEVNVTIISPKPGDETTIEEEEGYPGEYDWSTQTNRPQVSVPEDANYYVDENDEYQYTYWISGYGDDEGYWDPVIGKFEEGKQYLAEFTLFAKEGYKFAENVKILVNGQEVDHIFGQYEDELWLGHPVVCQYKAETTDEVKTADENPATGDNVYVYLAMFGACALVLTSRKLFVKE